MADDPTTNPPDEDSEVEESEVEESEQEESEEEKGETPDKIATDSDSDSDSDFGAVTESESDVGGDVSESQEEVPPAVERRRSVDSTDELPVVAGNLPIRDRLAQSLREGGPVEAGAELTSTYLSPLREFALPLATLVGMIVVVISFRAVLLPFVLAVALVYLMEPIVGFIGRRPGKEEGLPRWVAVILVYLSFIAVVTTTTVFVVPTFVSEIVRFAEEVPEFVQEFRSERLPGMNREVQDFLRNYLPVKSEGEQAAVSNIIRARTAMMSARRVAAARATAHGNAVQTVRWATDIDFNWESGQTDGTTAVQSYTLVTPTQKPPSMTLDDALTTSGWVYGEQEERAGFVIRPEGEGALRVDLRDVAIEVEQLDDNSWVLRQKDGDSVPVQEQGVTLDEMFNLERRLDEIIEGLVSTSNERLGDAIEFAQKLVVGIVGAFVGIILTLMVAAFMSIDLPRVMAFLRSLVPRKMRSGYDVLIEQLDTGLAGVVRGQLLICVVNGVLTYIGLWVIGVKFSVLLAVVAGILSLIPVFGTILSTVPIVLVGLTDGLMVGLFALGWILFIHGLEANILNPKIIGTSAHIHPVIVIFALLAGESAYGLVGALLAVPTASILLTLFNFVRTRAWKQAESREPST